MKKILLIICILSGIISAKAQIGADCNHPIGISPNGYINNNIQNGTYMWFRFTADTTNKKIELKKHPLSGGHIHAIGLLADDCNTITILDSAKIVPGNDSLLVINATNLVVGTSYFIVTERDKPTCTKCVTGAAEFDLCLQPLLPYSFGICSNQGCCAWSNAFGVDANGNPFFPYEIHDCGLTIYTCVNQPLTFSHDQWNINNFASYGT